MKTPAATGNVWHEYGVTRGKLKGLKAWTRAFKTVKTKYPKVGDVIERKIRVVVLDVQPTDTADASWSSRLSINLKGSPGSSYVETLVHETVHAFEDLQPDGFEIAAGYAGYGKPPFSHNYFENRPVEDFAECFRQFFTEPARLKSKSPEKYADMARRVAGS